LPRIRCHYIECVFLDAGYCGASAVEIDPDVGCMTFTHLSDASDDDWNEEGLDEIWERDELLEPEEDEDDLWMEGEEEEET